jgi:hypothetical protein
MGFPDFEFRGFDSGPVNRWLCSAINTAVAISTIVVHAQEA